ncbi:MAG: HAD-IIA family hydrolase [Verrucomicrobiota bacterium]|nr:HAD-IIA family hydrolase [Verrucomicrobiota bacterium]
MDGVIYSGGQLIPGAVDFIGELLDQDRPFMFLTNNSQRTRRDIMTRLNRLSISVNEKHIFTCADATASYLARQKPGGTAYVIGEGGLLTALHEQGFSVVDRDPDFVVIGECRTFNAEMMEAALNLLLGGAKFIATNLDQNCPTSDGMRPGCGALVSMLERASGKKAFSVGKPSPVMMRGARKELSLEAKRTVMIGDTMSTDILGGHQLGYYTILVLSGTTRSEDLATYSYRPDMVVGSIADIRLDMMDEVLGQSLKSLEEENQFIEVA